MGEVLGWEPRKDLLSPMPLAPVSSFTTRYVDVTAEKH